MLGLFPVWGSILDPAGLEEPQHPPRAASAALLQHQQHPLTAQQQPCLQRPNPQREGSGCCSIPFPMLLSQPRKEDEQGSRPCATGAGWEQPLPSAVLLLLLLAVPGPGFAASLGLDLHRFLKGSVLFPSF